VRPSRIEVPEADLADLRDRLDAATRRQIADRVMSKLDAALRG
jgi:hypothetical protein